MNIKLVGENGQRTLSGSLEMADGVQPVVGALCAPAVVIIVEL